MHLFKQVSNSGFCASFWFSDDVAWPWRQPFLVKVSSTVKTQLPKQVKRLKITIENRTKRPACRTIRPTAGKHEIGNKMLEAQLELRRLQT